MLHLDEPTQLAIVAHVLDGLPDEACGLLAGRPGTDRVERWYPCGNAARSAKLYTVEPRDQLRAERDAEDAGLAIVGVVHSHTHTDAWPSPTDVEDASGPLSDPTWHYVIVSLRDEEPSMRSFRIVERAITEEPVVVADRI